MTGTTRTRQWTSAPCCLLLIFAVSISHADFDAERFADIVEKGMTMWQVPGMAVAVIDNDELVFQRGFGNTAVSGGTPVDEHTLFANASTTKAMVVAGLLMLADEGKLSLDDLAIEHIPELRFHDPALTVQVTLRDLLAHRTGLPSTDVWTFIQLMPLDEQIRRLAKVEPIASPRTRLIYQNTMYELAGLIIERVSGQAWHEFLTDRLWRPIGMLETFGARGAIRGRKSHVVPHEVLNEEVRQVDWSFPPDLFDAAGSAWTSIHDMALWAGFLLDDGVTRDGKRLISEEGMANMFEPHQLSTPDDFYPTVELTRPQWRTYGLGWFQQDFNGRAIDFHTGSLTGLIAIIGLDRSAGKAIIVLGNRDHAEMRHALLWEVMDDTPAANKRDWNQDVFDLYAKEEAKARDDWQETVSKRAANTTPRQPLAAYAGTYRNKINGDVRVELTNDRLHVRAPRLDVPMTHWHYDTFLAKDSDWQYGSLVVFDFDADGNIAAINLFRDEYLRLDDDEADDGR